MQDVIGAQPSLKRFLCHTGRKSEGRYLVIDYLDKLTKPKTANEAHKTTKGLGIDVIENNQDKLATELMTWQGW